LQRPSDKLGATEDAIRKACGKKAGVTEFEMKNPFAQPKIADGLLPLGDDIKLLFERVG
jgi:ATP-dependent Clp protease ATP-binding subunit ClpC